MSKISTKVTQQRQKDSPWRNGVEEWLCSHGCRTAVIANPIKSIQFIDMGQFQCFASNYLHVKVLMLQMKMTTFPLGWLDLHHSESVLGLQPGEVGSAFSPLRTYRWKCYYNEEARTIIYPLSNKFQIDVYFFEVYTHCEAPKLIFNKIEIHPF